jgi:hypothetical protein
MKLDSSIKTVVLTVYDGVNIFSYYEDWLDAFKRSPVFDVTAFNLFAGQERRAAMRELRNAELVVALHACSADRLDFIFPLREAIKARRGRFLMLVGNEYNLPWIRLADKRKFLKDTGADWVGTQLTLEAGQWLYEGTGASVLALPHAANEAVFNRQQSDEARGIDIGGRSFRYPVYIGDDERNRVYACFSQLGPAAGLKVDIANGERLGRENWAAFLNNCRATLGTEAGSWYLEHDDQTVLPIRDYIRARSAAGAITIRADSPLHSIFGHLPPVFKAGLKLVLGRLPIRHEALETDESDFAEIQAQFFAGRPRCPVYSKCVSSRHFEAAATGTCQILTRGRYNDIFVADRDYIPLDPDLSNAQAAIERFRDPAERQRIAQSAHDLVHAAHTYRHRLAALHQAVSSS